MQDKWTAARLVTMIEKKYPTDLNGYNPTVILYEVAQGCSGQGFLDYLVSKGGNCNG